MIKLLVHSLLYLNLTFSYHAWAQENTADHFPIEGLTQENIQDTQYLSQWLAKNSNLVNKEKAALFFSEGLQMKEKKQWGPAVKAFGASMVIYPKPQTIIEFVHSIAHSLGKTRFNDKKIKEEIFEDMAFAHDFYNSALASNQILNQLSKTEENQLKKNMACLKKFLNSRIEPKNCEPLMFYHNASRQQKK